MLYCDSSWTNLSMFKCRLVEKCEYKHYESSLHISSAATIVHSLLEIRFPKSTKQKTCKGLTGSKEHIQERKSECSLRHFMCNSVVCRAA